MTLQSILLSKFISLFFVWWFSEWWGTTCKVFWFEPIDSLIGDVLSFFLSRCDLFCIFVLESYCSSNFLRTTIHFIRVNVFISFSCAFLIHFVCIYDCQNPFYPARCDILFLNFSLRSLSAPRCLMRYIHKIHCMREIYFFLFDWIKQRSLWCIVRLL